MVAGIGRQRDMSQAMTVDLSALAGLASWLF